MIENSPQWYFKRKIYRYFHKERNLYTYKPICIIKKIKKNYYEKFPQLYINKKKWHTKPPTNSWQGNKRQTLTWLKDISLRVCGPRAIIACRGSRVRNIPDSLRSPKYKRLASSRPSCQVSCHRIATRISSSETWGAGQKAELVSVGR